MCKLLKLPVSLCLLTLMSNLSLAEGLKETYQKALENDHSFKAAEAAYEAGKQNKALGRAGLLPQISGSGITSFRQPRNIKSRRECIKPST